MNCLVSDTDLQAFVDKVHEMRVAYYNKSYNKSTDLKTTFTRATKYARIVHSDGPSESVYCFVDLSNGDILKAASWKVPAKHARGNIFNDNPLKGCTPHGAEYLRS